jgi:hypothetical protein
MIIIFFRFYSLFIAFKSNDDERGRSSFDTRRKWSMKEEEKND